MARRSSTSSLTDLLKADLSAMPYQLKKSFLAINIPEFRILISIHDSWGRNSAKVVDISQDNE